MKRDLLDAIGKIDPRYIEEAAGVQEQAEWKRARQTSEQAEEPVRMIEPGRRRSGWAVAAAALFLALSVGTAWMLLSQRNPGGVNPSYTPGDTPVYTGELNLSNTDRTEELPFPEETTAPPELQYIHALDQELEKLTNETNSEDVALACDYITSKTPSAKNEMTGLFAGKNLILITAQNFAPEVIDPERTPTLYRLATQGIEFTDYYQPAWGGTAPSVFAFLTGLVPANGTASTLDAVGKNMSLTLGNQLRQRGYFSRAYTDFFNYDYEHQDLTLPNFGYDDLLGDGNGLELVLTDQWPRSDWEMMDVVIAQINGMQPFSIYCATCSGIGVYDVRGNKMAVKHWSEVEDLSCSDPVKAYLAANMEVEYALRDLVEALEQEGIADDTVIVLTSSEYPYALEQNEDYGNTEDYLAELYGYEADDVFKRDHSTLIVWSGCLEGNDYRVTTPTSSLDILPTLSNLFGLEYDSRLFVGRDVFSDREPFVFWPDGSWKTDKGCYNAETKVCTSLDGSELSEQYLRLRYEAVTASVDYSAAVLKTDLFALLFPTETGLREDGWLYTPGPDPCEVVREAICRQSEKDYTISLSVEEVREDVAEKQKLLSGAVDSQLGLRNGFGGVVEELRKKDPEDFTVVYARYAVEYDHTKTYYRDGHLDQYFYLVRQEDGSWSIFDASYALEATASDP